MILGLVQKMLFGGRRVDVVILRMSHYYSAHVSQFHVVLQEEGTRSSFRKARDIISGNSSSSVPDTLAGGSSTSQPTPGNHHLVVQNQK